MKPRRLKRQAESQACEARSIREISASDTDTSKDCLDSSPIRPSLAGRLRVAGAMGILLGGGTLAWLFRQEVTTVEPPEPIAGEESLVRRKLPGPHFLVESRSRESAPSVAVTPATPDAETHPLKPLMSLTPTDLRGAIPPPDLPRHLPASVDSAPAVGFLPNPPPLMAESPTPVAAGAVDSTAGDVIHRIVDGDSLEELGLRYLGDRRRASEIFQANRQVLRHPDLLPIGAELRIPLATRP